VVSGERFTRAPYMYMCLFYDLKDHRTMWHGILAFGLLQAVWVTGIQVREPENEKETSSLPPPTSAAIVSPSSDRPPLPTESGMAVASVRSICYCYRYISKVVTSASPKTKSANTKITCRKHCFINFSGFNLCYYYFSE